MTFSIGGCCETQCFPGYVARCQRFRWHSAKAALKKLSMSDSQEPSSLSEMFVPSRECHECKQNWGSATGSWPRGVPATLRGTNRTKLVPTSICNGALRNHYHQVQLSRGEHVNRMGPCPGRVPGRSRRAPPCCIPLPTPRNTYRCTVSARGPGRFCLW
jgi:hypothetical protein